jgi:hypothetical protein
VRSFRFGRRFGRCCGGTLGNSPGNADAKLISIGELDTGGQCIDLSADKAVSRAAPKLHYRTAARPAALSFSLFSGRPPRLSKPDTLAATILFNECNSRSLKCSFDFLNRIRRNLPSIFFEVDNRRKAQLRILREGGLIHLQ